MENAQTDWKRRGCGYALMAFIADTKTRLDSAKDYCVAAASEIAKDAIERKLQCRYATERDYIAECALACATALKDASDRLARQIQDVMA